jgi:hypothetical protein
LSTGFENSRKICNVPHIQQIWDEKKELNRQQEKTHQNRQECMAEVLSQPQSMPAGHVRLPLAAVGRHSIELKEIERTLIANPDPQFRGVC